MGDSATGRFYKAAIGFAAWGAGFMRASNRLYLCCFPRGQRQGFRQLGDCNPNNIDPSVNAGLNLLT